MLAKMIDRDLVKQLQKTLPRCGWVSDIAKLDIVADALPYEVFREPVAVTELNDGGSNRLVNLDAAYLTAWSPHMPYSMRVRLRALEPAIIAELAAGRALAAQVLLRSHLEAAAVAALCVETLKDSDRDELSRLVPKTLFGTALFNKSKRDERVAQMLTYSEQRTITIAQAMAALHKFAYPEGTADNTSIAYSLLCEASHPNHRGTRLFAHTEEVDSGGEYGWYVTYSARESVPKGLTKKFVELLLFSMRNGYAATELLRNMYITNSDEGVTVRGVSEDVGNNIWVNILQRKLSRKTRRADRQPVASKGGHAPRRQK
jgi:hypothetical protein